MSDALLDPPPFGVLASYVTGMEHHPERPIVIIGPMGSGKSTIGRLLATRLGLPFVDNDAVLEEQAGRTAAEIAGDDGVDALHDREATLVREALDRTGPAVITAAASTVTGPELRARMHEAAFVVWLTAAAETLARRTDSGSTGRPRLEADQLALAEEQRRVRDPLFAAVADLLVATDGPIDGVIDDIVANLRAVS